MKFVIEGPPRTKKNHQRILRGRGGRPFVAPSKNYEAWERAAVPQLQAQYRRQLATTDLELGSVCIKVDRRRGFVVWVSNVVIAPVNLRAVFYRDRDVGDLDNFIAAACDALEKAHVIGNDKQVRAHDGSRLAIDRKRPRVEIEITPLVAVESGAP